MSDSQLEDVARVCNRYPDIQLTYDIAGGRTAAAGDAVTLQVDLQREQAGELRPVDAPRYPARKEEQWWLVVGDPKASSLLAIKRVSLQRKSRVKLEFAAPSRVGTHNLVLYYMCDSYMGCDQVRNASLIYSCAHAIFMQRGTGLVQIVYAIALFVLCFIHLFINHI